MGDDHVRRDRGHQSANLGRFSPYALRRVSLRVPQVSCHIVMRSRIRACRVHVPPMFPLELGRRPRVSGDTRLERLPDVQDTERRGEGVRARPGSHPDPFMNAVSVRRMIFTSNHSDQFWM